MGLVKHIIKGMTGSESEWVWLFWRVFKKKIKIKWKGFRLSLLISVFWVRVGWRCRFGIKEIQLLTHHSQTLTSPYILNKYSYPPFIGSFQPFLFPEFQFPDLYEKNSICIIIIELKVFIFTRVVTREVPKGDSKESGHKGIPRGTMKHQINENF